MRVNRWCVRFLVALLAPLTLSSCAVMFAEAKMPDVSKVVPGADRAVVDSELGSPISDIPVHAGRGIRRKCTYKVIVKNGNQDGSTMGKVADSFVGLVTHEYQVTYDAANRVVDAAELVSAAN